MPERIELNFELTREDIFESIREYLETGPEWKAAAAAHRKKDLRSMLISAPFIVVGTTLLIGRTTDGMYTVGAIIGAFFAIFLVITVPNIDIYHGQKKEYLNDARKADLSRSVGPMYIAISRAGAHIRDPERELHFSWRTVVPQSTDAFLIMRYGTSEALIIPKRVFESQAAAQTFLQSAQAWWAEAQQENVDKLVNYLAEHDAACRTCRYNLRGVRAANCPECGRALSLHELQAPPSTSPETAEID